MAKSMLINVTHPEESRVAIVDDGVLDGFEIETIQHGQIKGNVYKGVVRNVNTALQAAFVDFGSDRDGFLPLDEVNFQILPARKGAKGGGKGSHRIEDHLKTGTKVTVQVVKDGFGSKPPTLSTFCSLPGRFLVLTPDSDAGGVSRKIEDQSQRERLRKILSELKQPEGSGLIVRTAGTDQNKTELNRDLRYLVRLWQAIQSAAKSLSAPALLYRERDLAIRTIRDYLTPEIKEIWIDDEHVHRRADQWFRTVMPTRRKLLNLYKGAAPLFTKFNIEDQIEQIFKRKVNLPSGGAIVIDSTEALTAVDVNSGKYRRSGNLEDTAFQTNKEAAAEIARQLRLRDLGGIIVIDFIDMRNRRNNRGVEKIVRDAMKGDKARHDITSISKLGLMEISRQRLKPTKTASTFVDCETCGGDGVVRAVESAALSALRNIHALVARGNLEEFKVSLPPEVAVHVLNLKREELRDLEKRHRTRILVNMDPDLKRHESKVDQVRRSAPPDPRPGAREKREGKGRDDRAREEPKGKGRGRGRAAKPAAKAARAAEDGDKRRRRGGGRGGRKAASAADPEAPAVTDEDIAEALEGEELPLEAETEGEEGKTKRKRRRRRGGRGRRGRGKVAASPEKPATEGGDFPPADEPEAEETKERPAAAAAQGTAKAPEEEEEPAMEVLVPSSKADGEPYLPPSITGEAQDAPDEDRASWWKRFRRVLRSDPAEDPDRDPDAP